MSAIADRLVAALADRYRIERELGQGGMATVYLAQDIKHDRKVAIKVLKPELAAVLGAERFIVEIKTTAALSHPHILPLFDSATADGFLYYVMPFIKGETIRDKLNRETQFGVDEAVRIAREVADALDYAHRNGVIHRDIKPENILLHDGRAMVMDFGIALAVSAAAGGRMTETGLSLGTPHYMSPEQATADKDITARSDVYSLASVLYEMLTGNPPHMGSSAQQIIMKIIAEPVQPVTALRKSVPPNVAAALASALEKLPADRFGSAREFAEALLNPAFGKGPAQATAASADGVPVLGRTISWRVVAAVPAVAFLVLAAWTMARGRPTATNAPVLRAELDILTRSDSGIGVGGLDISPDGSMIVYSARPAGSRTDQLYLRRLDDRIARPIPGTEGANFPAFSPDGSSIAFVLESRTIRRIGVAGGVAETIAQGTERSIFGWLRWGTDGFIYFTHGRPDGYSRVPELGGDPTVILRSNDPGSLELLPGGRHVLYVECCGAADVRVLELESGETKSLGVRARTIRYLSSGHLLLLTDDVVRAVPFDARKLAVRGEPRPVIDSASANGAVVGIATSANGTAAYFVNPVSEPQGQRPVLVDLAGNERPVSLPTAGYLEFRFSPDGRRVAYAATPVDNPKGWGVFVHDLVVGTTTPLTRDSSDFTGYLVWRKDGRELLYVVDDPRDSVSYILSSRADGSESPDTLWRGLLQQTVTEYLSPLSIAPDEKRVLLQRERTGGKWDLVIASLDSTLGTPTDYLVADWVERYGVLSPDGRWVAYESNEEAPADRLSARRLYVRSFPEPGERIAVSDSSATRPRWASDGRTIYYWRGRTLVAASVVTTPTFRVTSRRDLFTRTRGNAFSYDVSPDGKQFVMAALPPEALRASAARERDPMRLVVVANWFSEVRRKLGEIQ